MLRRSASATYTLVPPDKFSAKWRAAKAAFFAEAGRPKHPLTPEITRFGVKLAKYKGASGIEKQLKRFEENLPGAYTTPSQRKQLQDALGSFSGEVERFTQTLKATVSRAPAGVNKDRLTTAADKLHAELRKIDLGLTREVNKLRNTLGESDNFRIRAATQCAAVRVAVRGALAFINARREDRDPAQFNREIQDRALALTQQIGEINKLTDLGVEFTQSQPAALFDALIPWATDGRVLPADAQAVEVLAELDEFEEAVNAVAHWAGPL